MEIDSIEESELKDLIRRLLVPSYPLRYDVLKILSNQTNAVDCFTICDELEKQGLMNVFEPAVERAIWDLRPLLIEKRGKKTLL